MYAPKKKFEEYAYVLDYLPQGRPDYRRPTYSREPIVLAIGEDFFTLLELVPKRNVDIALHERVYIGKGFRDKIDHVKRRITYNDLTAAAKAELPYVLEKIIKERESFFVDFFNKAQPITMRMHQLELLPGIGKKIMWEILEERRKKPFESFKDLTSRVKIPDPVKAIVKRILIELEGEDRYYLFVRPFKPQQRTAQK